MLCWSFHGSPSLWWRLQTVADATDGGQQFDRKWGVDFPPQPADVDINHIRFTFKVIIPDMLLDHLARDYLIRVIDQVFEQRKLFRCQLNRLSFSLNVMGTRIHHQIPYFQ